MSSRLATNEIVTKANSRNDQSVYSSPFALFLCQIQLKKALCFGEFTGLCKVVAIFLISLERKVFFLAMLFTKCVFFPYSSPKQNGKRQGLIKRR